MSRRNSTKNRAEYQARALVRSGSSAKRAEISACTVGTMIAEASGIDDVQILYNQQIAG